MEAINWATINGKRFDLYEKYVVITGKKQSVKSYPSHEDAKAAFCKMLWIEEQK